MRGLSRTYQILALLLGLCSGAFAQAHAIPGLLWTKPLNPPLHNEVVRARFSLDGNYILTQDDAGLAVISRSSLAVLFRIDQPEILGPQFTPDSTAIVFRTRSLRVERWDIATQKLASAQDVTVPDGCRQAELSPDGKWLGCFDRNLTLKLIEVSSGKIVFEKSEFRDRSYLSDARTVFTFEPFLSGLIQMEFSPNGRYFLAGTFYFDRLQAGQFARGTTIPRSVGIDLTSQKPVSLNDNLKRAIAGGGAFVGDAKFVVPAVGTEPGGAFSFPEGKLLEKLDIPGNHVYPATKGDTVLLPDRNLHRYPKFGENDGPTNKVPGLCLFDIANRAPAKLSGQKCLDAFDGTIAAPGPNGTLGLYSLKGEPAKLIKLAPRRRTDVTWANVSPDLKWVSVANEAGGGVWNLETGERILYLPAFYSGLFGATDQFHASFSEKPSVPPSLKKYDLNTRQVAELTLPAKGTNSNVGSVIIHRETFESSKDHPSSFDHDTKLDVLDAATLKPLWSLGRLTLEPLVWTRSKHDSLLVQFNLESDFAKDEIRKDPVLKRQYDSLTDRTGVAYLRIVAARTGQVLGGILTDLRRGEVWTIEGAAAGNYLVLRDTSNQIRVYSLSTGKQTSLIAGIDATISERGDLLAVQSSEGTLELYDLATAQVREHYTFPTKVAMAQFVADDNKLFVLTADQTACLIDVSKFAKP